ncbi:MAG: hypothetical protein LLG44_13890 [Chloroflexi bacterium]|nr:hypothetical protein [Chloroflexota bacterium]
MTKVCISAGICGFETEVKAEADDNYEVRLVIVSDCARIQHLATELASVAALQEISKPINDTLVYQAAGRCRLHSACPVPCGIMKAVENAAGLALPADVQINVLAK